MGAVQAKREAKKIEFNQARARARKYLEKCRPDYIENDELLGLAPEAPREEEDEDLDVGEEEEEDAADGEDEDDGEEPEQGDAKVKQDDARVRAQGRIAEQQKGLLQSAAAGRKWQAMSISRKPHIKVNFTDAHGRTALFLAAERGHSNVVDVLLSGNATLRAKVDKPNHDGWTPLAAAVFHGQVRCIETLMAAQANVNHQDKHGCTPLVFAASSPKLFLVDLVSKQDRKRREVVRRMAFSEQHKADKKRAAAGEMDPKEEGSTFQGMDPLKMWEYYPNRIELIVMDRLLSKNRIQIDLFDKQRRTPLIYAARYGRMHAVSRLLAAKASIHWKDKEGKSALHHAACYDHIETVEMLLAAGASVNSTDEYFRTPLHGALDAKDEGMANLLLKANASVNAYDCEGRTPIMLAMDQKNPRLFGSIIEQRSNLDVLDRRGWNVVIYSIETGMFGEVLPMLQKLGDRAKLILQNRDPQGRNCFHHAVQLPDVAMCNKVIEQLLPMDPEASTIGDCNGDTTIHFAAELGRLEALRMLIKHSPRADFLNNRGETPVHYAAHGGHIACVVALVEDLGDGAACDAYAQDKDGKTMLMHACISGNLDLVNLLVSNKEGAHSELALPPLDVNVRDCFGTTALAIAAREGHWQLLPSLVLAGASIATKDYDGFTALHLASLEDEALSASCLLDLGVDPDATDDRGWTPLMHAAARGSDEVCRVLVDSGANLDARNWDGDTAAQICARRREAPEAVQVTKDILTDAILDHDRPTGSIAAQGHFNVSIVRAEDLYLEGKVGELNVYVCLILVTQENSSPQVAFTSCVLGDSHPEWHEVFRFDTTMLDSSASLVAWVMAAPGNTPQDVIDSATLGLNEEELRKIRLHERMTGNERRRGKNDFTSAIQDSFSRMMRKADKEQDSNVQKLRKLALAQRRGAEPTMDLKTAAEEEKDQLPLNTRRWLEVNHLRALLSRSGCTVVPPLAPQCHLPLGCVVVRYRHLRSSVWGEHPVDVFRTLRLNCRGSLKLEVDFRPKFFACRDNDEERHAAKPDEDEIYDMKPLNYLPPEQLEVIEAAITYEPDPLAQSAIAPVTVDQVMWELENEGKPRKHPEELWKRFRQVSHWSHQVLQVRADLGYEEAHALVPKKKKKDKDADGKSTKDKDKEEGDEGASAAWKAMKQAYARYQAAKEAQQQKQEALDRPVGAPTATTAHGRSQPGAVRSQPAVQEKKKQVRLPKLDPEPWLEDLLASSRFCG